ncbi:MAG: UvrD-helicase domain-containing protein [Leptospirales bacterium]|nr:UvrD-helicase domain-containing protein [Leptospirales bacterium]
MSLTEKIKAELIRGLNDVQRAAVEHGEGPLLIVAGAGSGKTRVITHRIAYLARIHNVAPWRIVAVTFTNKAAGEMRERLASIMGPMAENVFVRTFHSLGLYLISRNADRLGLKSSFSVLDQSAQTTLLKTVMKDLKMNDGGLTPQAAAQAINRARDAYQSPEDGGTDAFYGSRIAEIYREYRKRLRAANAVDFGDLQYEAVRLLEQHEDLLAYYQNLWRYLLIDEYQDTNRVQYLLGRMLAASRPNILAVGDDDQSIYSWRGADISNILNFQKDYPSARLLRLEENYRSTPEILRAASTLIAHNRQRHEKTLYTQRESGDRLRYQSYEDEEGEARAIVSMLRSLRSQGRAYREMAVFYRTNAQSRALEKSLQDDNIPYVLVGDIRFYERKEIKDLLAYLSVAVNPADDLSLERILNTPPRGAGETTLDKLRAFAAREGLSLLAALGRVGELPGIRAAGKLVALSRRFADWTQAAGDPALEAPASLAERILRESGYEEWLENDSSHDAPGRLENLREFLAGVERFQKDWLATPQLVQDQNVDPASFVPDQARQSPPMLRDYLQRIALYTSDVEGRSADGGESVFLMTLHNAKGLEFPVVFIAGLEEGYIPHALAVEEGGLEEERRLLYVGLTRAREQLFLSGARRRLVFGGYENRATSRFLREVDSRVFVSRPGLEELHSSPPEGPPRAAAGGTMHWRGKSQQRTDLRQYRVGERVVHQRYGPGAILSAEAAPVGQKVCILFDAEQRERYFLTAYTPLRPEK